MTGLEELRRGLSFLRERFEMESGFHGLWIRHLRGHASRQNAFNSDFAKNIESVHQSLNQRIDELQAAVRELQEHSSAHPSRRRLRRRRR